MAHTVQHSTSAQNSLKQITQISNLTQKIADAILIYLSLVFPCEMWLVFLFYCDRMNNLQLVDVKSTADVKLLSQYQSYLPSTGVNGAVVRVAVGRNPSVPHGLQQRHRPLQVSTPPAGSNLNKRRRVTGSVKIVDV